MSATAAFIKLFAICVLAYFSQLQLANSSKIYSGSAAGKLTYPNGTTGIINSGEFPYIAALEINSTIDMDCSAVIIRSDVVLTAGHCVKCQKKKDLKVRAGTYSRHEKIDKNSLIQLKDIKAFVIHERFSLTNHGEYDIAILWLETPFELNKYVNVIEMAKESDYGQFIGETGIILGWGYIETGKRPDTLLHSTLVVSPKKKCVVLDDLNPNWTAGSLCLLPPAKKEGSCRGDSGGPFVVRKNEQSILLGITSFGAYDPDMNICYPAEGLVFTDVSFFRSWIDNWLKYDDWQ